MQRACVECDEVYLGALACPKCGAPGEPLDDDVQAERLGEFTEEVVHVEV